MDGFVSVFGKQPLNKDFVAWSLGLTQSLGGTEVYKDEQSFKVVFQDLEQADKFLHFASEAIALNGFDVLINFDEVISIPTA